MRLFVCLLASAAFHLAFFAWSPITLTVPTLSIALEPRLIDLQIRAVVRKTTFPSDQPKDSPAPPPKPEKALKGTKKTERTVPKYPLKSDKSEKDQQAPSKEPRQYISSTESKPRLIHQAEYLSNPPPKYPDIARRRQLQGTVTLLVEVDHRGLVTNLKIARSSGVPILDEAATAAVAQWRFTPATVEDQQVASRVIVPIDFKLTR